jgi:hypothetical protein
VLLAGARDGTRIAIPERVRPIEPALLVLLVQHGKQGVVIQPRGVLLHERRELRGAGRLLLPLLAEKVLEGERSGLALGRPHRRPVHERRARRALQAAAHLRGQTITAARGLEVLAVVER